MGVFLFLSIVFNTLFASSYKIAVRNNCNLEVVNTWLYVGSTATVAGYILMKRHLAYHPHALALGIVAGAMVLFATLSFFHHMKYGQLSASWTVISLAVGFPVLASIFMWQERPSVRQMIGLALIAAALILFGRHETDNRRRDE